MALIIEQHSIRVPVPEGYLTVVLVDEFGKFVHRCVSRELLEGTAIPIQFITDEMLTLLDNHYV